MGYAFISYSTKNKETADAIKSLFNKNSIETWMAPNDIPPGSKYAQVISKAIKNCSCFVLLLTKNAQNSVWVPKEVERAINYKKVIIPVQLDNSLLNDEFEMYISTDQILPIRIIDETSDEVSNLLRIVSTHTRPDDIDLSEIAQKEIVRSSELIDSIQVGTVIEGKYKILREIGRGGYCIVYLSYNEKTNKTWAIKAIAKKAVRYEEFAKVFSTELTLLNTLSHPGIPRIIDIIETYKYFLIVMDYIEGVSIDRLIEETGAQDESVVIEWAIQLCEILGFLHSQKPAIIYNDLKPSNIMLKPDGKITLIDFGTSQRLTEQMQEQDSVCLGTANYSAPEKYVKGRIDQRTDIYSVGATIYYFVTGNDPITAQYITYPAKDNKRQMSKGLEHIISKCVQNDPMDRYQSIAELVSDLRNVETITKKLSKTNPLKRLVSFFDK